LQAPDKSGGSVGQRVDGRKLRDEVRDSRIIHRCDQPADIDLCEVQFRIAVLLS